MMQPEPTFQPRSIPILAIALGVAFGLFTLMHTVITVSGHGLDKVESLPTIDFVRLRRDSQVEAMQRRNRLRRLRSRHQHHRRCASRRAT
jgi:periplasmic protein TonB